MRVLLPLRKSAAQPNSNSNDNQGTNNNETNNSFHNEEQGLEGVAFAEQPSTQEEEDYFESSPKDDQARVLGGQQAGAVSASVASSKLPLLFHHQKTSSSSVAAKKPKQLSEGKSISYTSASRSPRRASPVLLKQEERKRPALEEEASSSSSSRKKRSYLDTKPPARKTNIMGGNRAADADASAAEVRDEPPVGTDDKSPSLPLWSRSSGSSEEEDPALTTETSSFARNLAIDNFAVLLKKRGLEIVPQEGDGNCLFRAVSLQVYGDATMHADVRKQCMDFMERDEAHFSHFVTGESSFQSYIQRKRQDGVHGNHTEIQAISELFNRPIEVFSPENGATPLNIFHTEYKTDDPPIRLSYHDGNHYNAVIDPLVPTAGLGLGLPGLQPGLADKLQMAKAVAASDAAADQMEMNKALKESEDDELQRALKDSSLSAEQVSIYLRVYR
jgi:hypothetical protein